MTDEKAAKRVANLATQLSANSTAGDSARDSQVSAAHFPHLEEVPAGVPFKQRLDELRRRHELARNLLETDPGIKRQREQGKLTVRERIQRLVDPGTFRELGTIAGSATYDETQPELMKSFQRANHVSGRARINGRPVVIGADDFSVRGGHADGAIARKATYTEGLARELRVPMVKLIDGSSGGGSVAVILKAGHSKLSGMPGGFTHLVKMLDEVPVVTACLGPAVGLGAAKAVASHFCVMPKNGSLFAAGPPVVIPATHENLTKAQLGGPAIHGTNGTVDNIVEDEEEAFQAIRSFLSYLPSNRWLPPPTLSSQPPESDPRDPYKILRVIPEENVKPYDPKDYLLLLADKDSIFEMGPLWGREVRVFLARFGGFPCFVFCGDPRYGGGALGTKSCEKLMRAIGIAGTFHLPIVNFVDCPGFSVGSIAEKTGTIRAGARLTNAAFDSRVPWFCCVVRRSYGVGGGILVARGEGDDAATNVRVAWPSGEWGSLPLAGGVEAAFKGHLEAIKDPKEREVERVKISKQIAAISNPLRSAEAFDVEEIISPLDTRDMILEWIQLVYETRIPALIAEDAAKGRGRGASFYLP